MSGDVVLTLSAQDAGFVRKMLEARAQAVAMGKEIDLIDKRGKNAKRSIGAMAGGMGIDLAKSAAAFAGVGSAIAAIATASRLVMAEYEQWRSRRTDAAGTFQKLPDLERKMADSLAPDDDLNLDQIRDGLMKLGDRFHVSMEKLIPAMTSALGGKGQQISASKAMAAVAAQAQYGTFAGQEEFSGNPGRFLDWQKAFGGTAEQQMAYGIEAQRLARDEDSQNFWQSGGVAIASGKQFGWDQRHGMALYAAVTQAANDKEGRLSTNMISQLERQIMEATARVKELAGKSGPERLEYIRSEQGTTIRHKMLEELGSNFTNLSRRDLRKLERQIKKEGIQGVGRLHGEAKPFAAALSLLDPGAPSFAYDTYRESFEATSKTPAEALEKLKRNRQTLNQSSIQELAHQHALGETQKEQAYLKQPGLAAQGTQMQTMPDVQKALGQGWFASKVAEWRRWWEGKDDILGTARANEEEMRRNLDKNQKAEAIGFAQQGPGADWKNFKPTPRAIKADALIRESYESFKAERERLEAIEATKKPSEVRKKTSLLIRPPGEAGRDEKQLAGGDVTGELKEMIRGLTRLINEQAGRGSEPTEKQVSANARQKPLEVAIKLSDPYGREINRSTARLLPARRLSIG